MKTWELNEAENQRAAVFQAALFMQERMDEEIPVSNLAQSVFFSKYHFTRVFNKITGMPPGRFLAELRVLTAEDLLLSTDLSFTEITYRVGYTSVGTFSTRFKLVTGQSPSSYRRTIDLSTSVLRGGHALRGDTRLVMRTMERAEAFLDRTLPVAV